MGKVDGNLNLNTLGMGASVIGSCVQHKADIFVVRYFY